MTSRENMRAVWKVYPEADCVELPNTRGSGYVYGILNKARNSAAELSELQPTEAEAWDDAASKLPSAPSPAGETASEPCGELIYKERCQRPKGHPGEHTYYWDLPRAPEPVSTEGLPSTFGQMTGNLKVPPIVEALGPLTERDLLGFAAEPAAPIAPAAVPESTELLPCPFCGMAARWAISTEVDDYEIQCINLACPVTVLCGGKTELAAINAWNTRTPAASPVAGVSVYQDAHITDERSRMGRAAWIAAAKPSAEGDGWIADGVALIAAERKRQVESEGWTPEHDDEHSFGEMTGAAITYAAHALGIVTDQEVAGSEENEFWPWDMKWWKPSPDPIRNLVKAGALIAAEIDRLKRLPAPPSGQGEVK